MPNISKTFNASFTSDEGFQVYNEKYFLYLRERSIGQVVAESGLLFIIDFLSVFGNIALCWIMYKSSSLRTLTNVFILVLAASDILMGLLCIPFSVAVLIRGTWLFGVHICRMQCFLVYALGFGSLQTMTLVAVNRYYRIVKPSRYRNIFTLRSTLGTIALVWVLTVSFLTIPFLTENVISLFSPGKSACVMFRNPESSKASIISVNMTIVTLSTIIPTVIIVFCYCRIFRLVGSHFNRVRPALATKSTSSQLKANVLEIKSTRTLFLVLIAFAVCWLPVFIIELIQTFFIPWWKLSRSCHLLWTFCGCLRSAVNPFIFASTSRSFRRRFWIVLKGGNSDSSGEILSNNTMYGRKSQTLRVSEVKAEGLPIQY